MSANGNQPNKLALGAGFGIGTVWIAIGLWCLVSGIQGYANHRSDYGLVWTLVGVLLLGGGTAAIVGTWWHQFPLKRKRHHWERGSEGA